jgi:hypothetical protein
MPGDASGVLGRKCPLNPPFAGTFDQVVRVAWRPVTPSVADGTSISFRMLVGLGFFTSPLAPSFD